MSECPVPARPVVMRRNTYDAQSPSEYFMVSLLRRVIDEGILRYATPVPTGAEALDVGCGGQPFRPTLDNMGYRYTGFDVHQNEAGTVDVLGTIDDTLPPELLSRGRFHFILCTEVLEHVLRWQVAFANLAQLLAPGGRLLMTCPHFYPPHEEPYDFWRPTLHTVEFHAQRQGLRPLEIRGAGDAWDILGTLISATRFRAAQPRPLDHLGAAIAQGARRLLAVGLRRGWLQRRIRSKGPMYLSVFAVVEKPKS